MSDWVTYNDPQTGFDFYYNCKTGDTTWEMPSEFKNVDDSGSAPPIVYDSSTLLSLAFNQTKGIGGGDKLMIHSESPISSDYGSYSGGLAPAVSHQGEGMGVISKSKSKLSTKEIQENTTEVVPFNKLSQFAQKMKLNKNYSDLARDHLERARYSRLADKTFDSSVKCIMCKERSPTEVFFPCEHFAVCNPVSRAFLKYIYRE